LILRRGVGGRIRVQQFFRAIGFVSSRTTG
jgi:hypothetical protein